MKERPIPFSGPMSARSSEEVQAMNERICLFCGAAEDDDGNLLVFVCRGCGTRACENCLDDLDRCPDCAGEEEDEA